MFWCYWCLIKIDIFRLNRIRVEFLSICKSDKNRILFYSLTENHSSSVHMHTRGKHTVLFHSFNPLSYEHTRVKYVLAARKIQLYSSYTPHEKGRKTSHSHPNIQFLNSFNTLWLLSISLFFTSFIHVKFYATHRIYSSYLYTRTANSLRYV